MALISVERLSTTGAEPRARLRHWNALVSANFDNLTVDGLDPERFRGVMAFARLGEVGLMCARSAPAVVSRRAEAGRVGRGPHLFELHLQLKGRSLNCQAGREAQLEPGDFTLCDSAQPSRIRFTEANQMLCVKLPAEKVRARLEDPERFICMAMPARSGASAVLSSFLRSLWSQVENGAADEQWGEAMGDVLLDLMALAYKPGVSDPAAASTRATRLRQARAYIESRLCDPDLDVGAIAAALGVTPRYVQMLFAAVETTPSAHIVGRRLELAAERLRPGVLRGGVTDAALSVGFNDVTHFGRAFRRRFGVSPSDYSAGVRTAPWARLRAAPAGRAASA